MIFTSFEFVLFFVAVLAMRQLCRSYSSEKWLLLGASYVFYMSWSIPCVLLIILSSLVDYSVGRLLGRCERTDRRRWLLAASIAANLGILGFFKYTNFIVSNAEIGLGWLGWDVDPRHYDIILPVGISFFTFQSMSYTIDVYRRKLEPCLSIRDFLLYVAFFPQLVAGPIVRAIDFLPQIVSRKRAKARDVEAGLAQFGLGAVKKVVISDQIAPFIDPIFANPSGYDGPTLLLGVLGYAVQIYCDFSGYSDMAIGCARIMGFKFLENFQMPYSATSITEFWRRWHISLSSWFRDYLYIPLGGNRNGLVRTYVNLMATMLLCGLWHGASWNFVLWGGLHGVALAVHRLWSKRGSSRSGGSPGWFRRVVSDGGARLLTLGVVLVGWVLFRAQTLPEAVVYLQRMFTWTGDGVRQMSPYILLAVVAVTATHLLVHKDRNWTEEIADRHVLVRVGAYASLILLVALLGTSESAPFIYFQF